MARGCTGDAKDDFVALEKSHTATIFPPLAASAASLFLWLFLRYRINTKMRIPSTASPPAMPIGN